MRGVWAAVCILALVGCGEVAMVGKQSFQSQYNFARNALEKGNYDTANRAYTRLLKQAGPLDGRIRLELAHSYLRAGDFSGAASMASNVAESNQGTARSAALSVQGTAEHEIGLRLLAKGNTKDGAARLTSAQKAIGEVLKTHPSLDPLGALAGRQASIAVRLKDLP